MADVKVRTGLVELTTVKLTPKILKQIPRLQYEQMRPLLHDRTGAAEAFKEGVLVGWIHGTAISGNSYERFLLLKTGEGEYGLYNAMPSTVERVKAKQIYVV